MMKVILHRRKCPLLGALITVANESEVCAGLGAIDLRDRFCLFMGQVYHYFTYKVSWHLDSRKASFSSIFLANAGLQFD